MADEKKANEGTYLVLGVADDEMIGSPTPTVEILGEFVSVSATEALKVASATNGSVGLFVVVPKRNWKMFKVSPQTTLKVEAVE